MPASRADTSGYRQNGVCLSLKMLSRHKNMLFLGGICICWIFFFAKLQAATVTVTIEFSDQSSQTFALAKSGEYNSGIEVIESLIIAIGGGLQRFDDPGWDVPVLPLTPWTQWWRYNFGVDPVTHYPVTALALYGLGLGASSNAGFDLGYWAIYTSVATDQPWEYAMVGLADLQPQNGSRIGLKYSTFDDSTGPSDSTNTVNLTLAAPPTGETPRLLSVTTIDSDRFALIFTTAPGCTYQLEQSESLANDDWKPWSGIWIATATQTTFTILIQENKPKYFYRLHLLP